jgi:hypothetical protein
LVAVLLSLFFIGFLPHCKLVGSLSHGSDAPCQEFHPLQRACRSCLSHPILVRVKR